MKRFQKMSTGVSRQVSQYTCNIPSFNEISAANSGISYSWKTYI